MKNRVSQHIVLAMKMSAGSRAVVDTKECRVQPGSDYNLQGCQAVLSIV